MNDNGNLFAWILQIMLFIAVFYVGRWTAPEPKPLPTVENAAPLELRVTKLEDTMACWQTIHPKRCQ